MMELFNDNPENNEFDWFPEFSDNPQDIDFNHLVDFENEMNEAVEATEKYKEDEFFAEVQEVVETPDEASYQIFSEVSKYLTGYEISERSEFLFDYVEELSDRCIVIPSSLEDNSTGETALKIQICLDEDGCAVAIVDGVQWDTLSHEDDMQIDGMRTLLITDISDDYVAAYDLTQSSSECISISAEFFSKMDGMLLEVYK